LALNIGTRGSLESDLTHTSCVAYMRASAAGVLQGGHSYRLSRVTTVVSYSYYLVAQTGLGKLGSSCKYFKFARASRKGGDYFIRHSNQYCNCCDGGPLREAVLTANNTLVYDHIGNTYHLSGLIELSEGQIPYPEQFDNKPDYEQKLQLQDPLMKYVLSTRTNWIN
jgi:hypothetical protein